MAASWPWRKILGFLVVGGACAVGYVFLSTALTYVIPTAGHAISVIVYAIFIPIAFFGQRRYAFRSSGKSRQEFLKYAGVQLVSVFASTWLLGALLVHEPIQNLLVFTAVAACSALISFVACNLVVFLDQEEARPNEVK